ncbi:MAG: hypothetical protein FJ218_00990 [Ignavibacteria bacterium]|nr:hypothetical protein [Ignavibacteria bacterium]
MQRILIIILLSLFTATFLHSQKTQYTKRTRNEVREGPGNYYDLLRVLPSGVAITIQDEKGMWLNIKTPDKTKGWMSKNCLTEAPPSSSKNLEAEWSSPKATKAGVAAAIRGFAERYGKTSREQIEMLDVIAEQAFSANDFLDFQRSTLQQVHLVPFHNIYEDFQTLIPEYHCSESEEGIGAGIAAKILSRGVVRNPALSKYVNLLGLYIVEHTPMNDVRFRFYVLDDERAVAFSLPGGFVFVSKGLIDVCSNEAELAGVIAHEIMHIILQHGIKELVYSKTKIHVEEAFEDMNKEFNESPDTTEEALVEFAQVAWETVNKPRTLKMETEADKAAAIILTHCGYDAQTLTQLIQKIEARTKNVFDVDIEEERPFAYLDFVQRRELLQEFLRNEMKHTSGALLEERFLSFVK